MWLHLAQLLGSLLLLSYRTAGKIRMAKEVGLLGEIRGNEVVFVRGISVLENNYLRCHIERKS